MMMLIITILGIGCAAYIALRVTLWLIDNIGKFVYVALFIAFFFGILKFIGA